jgi:hypothetical protein
MFHCKCQRRTYVRGEWCCVIEQKKMLALKIKEKRELEALYERVRPRVEQARETSPSS